MTRYLFNNQTRDGERPFASYFSEDFNRYFEVISKEQLLDRLLWRLLERQFDLQWDTIDQGWRGEYWGKLMRGACMVYAHTRSEELYEVLTETVENMLKKADGLGRICTYEQEYEYHGWDIWCRKYVMLGMEFYYDICKDASLKAKIVKALEAQADYLVKTLGEGEGKTPISQTSRNWGAINSVSLLQPIVILNQILQKESYSAFIEMLLTTDSMENFNIFEYIRNDSLYPYEYPITKAYEMISCAEGALDLYRQTGREELLHTCVRFADKVLESDFTVVGGIGCYDETFDNSTKKQVLHTDINKQETCVVVTFMKFLYSLYLINGKKEYVDAIEKSFFNLYLGALNDQPYYGNQIRPLFYSYSPVFDNPRWQLIGGSKNISGYAGFGCCVAIGAAGIGIIPKLNVLGTEEKVLLNLFMKGRYEQGETVFSVDSDYPRDGKIKVKVEGCRKEGFSLRIRFPYWAKSAKLSINGVSAVYKTEEGYLLVEDRIKAGDEVDIHLEAPVVLTPSVSVNEEAEGLFAVSKCALTYSVDSMKESLEKRYDIEGLRQEDCRLTEDGLLVNFKSGEAKLDEYRNCGKNYYRMPNISVWLKTEKYSKE